MNRIDRRFADLGAASRRALVAYVTAGFPKPGATLPVLHALREGGADVIELGMPFSDPMADGPTIQRACEVALGHRVGLGDVLAMVARFREDDGETPLVLMGYLNPIVRFGMDAFAAQAAAVGVDGLLIVDAPPEESDVLAAAHAAGLHQIFLLAPTSSERRVARVLERAGGFVYYVSLTGITGAGHLAAGAVAERVRALRAVTDLPIGVGFGIKTPEQAVAVAAAADAVVIGSALIEAIDGTDDPAGAARRFLAPFRGALDGMLLERTG